MFSLTKYRSKKDNNTQDYYEVTWEHFVNRISKHDIRHEKDGPAFSAVQYAPSAEGFKFKEWIFWPKTQRKKGMVWENENGVQRITDLEYRCTRANVNVLQVSMVVMDFDQGNINEIHEKLKDFNHFIYTTFSNTKEQAKFRLIVPLKAPVPVSQYRDVWEQINRLTGGFADQSCKDPARLHFLPSCPPSTAGSRYSGGLADKKAYAPKLTRRTAANASQKKKPKKMKRGDYRTLKVVEWFVSHSAYQGPTGKPNQHWVDCPWKADHTGGNQGQTDTCIYTDNTENWPTFHCSHNHCNDKTIKDVIKLWGDADNFCEKQANPKDIKTDVVIRPLGHDDTGHFYYQCSTNNSIVPLKASEHRELNFYGITADIDYWWKHFGDPEKGKVDWRKAAISMMMACQDVGFFRPNSVRGGGVWEDESRTVVHLGKRLLVDSVEIPITKMKSDHIYEAMVRNVELKPPLPKEQSARLVDLVTQLPIINDVQKMLFAGQLVCGMLSGILPWRPHLWLTGDAGSGKTSILRNVVHPLWTPMGGIYCEGKTTEAGIRQQIRHSAVPIIIDESEANQKDEAQRISNLIGLARSSSSDSMANVYKGTVTGGGLSFTVRSSFIFCSVAHSLEWAQDKERFSMIQIKSSKKTVDGWPRLRKAIKEMLTKDYALALYSRCINNIEIIKEAVDSFHRVMAVVYPKSTPRWRDQVGTLLAGAYSLLSNEPMPDSYAFDTFEKVVGWSDLQDKDDTNASLNALKILFSHIVQENSQKKSIGEFVQHIIDPATIAPDQSVLNRYGMHCKDDHIFIASDHPQTKTIFRNNGITGHYGLLGLMDGTESGITMSFGAIKSKAVKVPLSIILQAG